MPCWSPATSSLNGHDPVGHARRCCGIWSATARSSFRATPTSRSPTSTTPRRSRGCRTACRMPILAAAEWAHDALGDERLAWLRRLPAERRLRIDDTMLLADPRLARLADRPASTGTSTRTSRSSGCRRTDARVICCGHTHMPEIRDLGWKHDRQRRAAPATRFDGDPTASWALIDPRRRVGHRRDPADRVRRAGRRQRDLGARPARATSTVPPRSARGSSFDDRAAHARVVVTGMGAVTALGNDVASTWDGLLAGRSGVRTIEAFDPSRLTVADRRRGP